MTMKKRLALLAVVVGCAGAHDVKTTEPDKPHEENALDRALDARDKADDALVGQWYEPNLLTQDVRPKILETMVSLDQLTLYDMDLDVHDDLKSFNLDARIYFQNRSNSSLKDVMFRLYANTPTTGEPPEKLVRGHCVQAYCTVESVGRDVIVVHPSLPLAPNARLRVVLHIEGSLKTIEANKTTMIAATMSSLQTMTGSGAPSDYGLLASGDDILSFGNFYPVVARHEGDNWDLDESTIGDIGPDELSHVRMHVELPSIYRVAASGVITREEEAGTRRRIDIAAGCMRDFALLASPLFTSADKLVEDPLGGVKVRSFFRTSDRKIGEKVLDVAAWSLADFEKRFGPYPYKELDLVEEALIGGAGGVEFAGLATVASMFYKPSGSPGGASPLETIVGMLMGNDGPMKLAAAEFTTAHEVGHQWWHGIVGSDSRLHPWQYEALAQFSAILYSEDRYGRERAKRDGDMNAKMGYSMMRMMGENDGPVDAPAKGRTQIAYGGIVYGKGPYYFTALRKQLGDAAFFGALQEYVKRYYLAFAPDNAIEDVMTRAAGAKGQQVTALTKRWLLESHGDDDLGKPSMGGMMSMAGGGAGGKAMPEMQGLMKMLGEGGGIADLLKQMSK
jgi:hypothetical protein